MPINVTGNNEISAGIEQYFKDNDIDIKDIRNLKLLLQTNNDLLEGGLRSNNITNFRNTYVINSSDSLDVTYPLDVYFNIENEMTKIVSIKLSFWIMPFRAYSTAATSGGVVSSASGGGETPTSSSGGGSTPTSSSVSTPSGGGATSAASTTLTTAASVCDIAVSNVGDENANGYINDGAEVSVTTANHTHTTPDHTHPAHTHTVTIAAHTHTVTIAAHTHTGGAHAHAITFGIYEEDNSPTIGFKISKDNGETFGSVLGTYTNNVTSLELKDYIASSGGYIIRFTSTARARLSVQLTCKLDITAR